MALLDASFGGTGRSESVDDLSIKCSTGSSGVSPRRPRSMSSVVVRYALMAAWASLDVDQIMAYFADDATFLPLLIPHTLGAQRDT